MNVAIIPARKGSKALIDKNILPLGNKPLIAHTIEVAISSNLFNKVIVSTDSYEYATIAKKYGAIVPFLRATELSTDTTPTSEVTYDVLRYLQQNDESYEYFACLQVSSPLRNAEDICKSYELLVEKRADAVISVCESIYPKPWVQELPSDNSMKNFIPKEYRNKPRQLLPPYYKIHGAIFWSKVHHYYPYTDPFEKNIFAYIMPPERSIDIDTEIDYELVKILYEKNKM